MLKQVIKKVDKGVLGTVTGTFRKITFHSHKNSRSSDHLIVMNIPHWLARRDAAYKTAVNLIDTVMDLETPVERRDLYLNIMKLMELAIHANNRFLFGVLKLGKPKAEDPFDSILEIIFNTSKALLALMDSSIIISNGKKIDTITRVVTVLPDIPSLHKIHEQSIQSEFQMRSVLKSLADNFQPRFEKEKILENKLLPKEDKIRYEHSLDVLLEDIPNHNLITVRLNRKLI
jgi:hypothetical protein